MFSQINLTNIVELNQAVEKMWGFDGPTPFGCAQTLWVWVRVDDAC